MKLKMLLIMIALSLAVFSIPATLLVLGGLLPTFAAKYSYGQKGTSTTKAVAYFNLAGIVPFVLEIIPYGQNIDKAMLILGASFTWICIYTAASAGWLIVIAMPKISKKILAGILYRRLETIKKRQEKLLEEWGPKVRREPLD